MSKKKVFEKKIIVFIVPLRYQCKVVSCLQCRFERVIKKEILMADIINKIAHKLATDSQGQKSRLNLKKFYIGNR